MSSVIAIDPGPAKSALVHCEYYGSGSNIRRAQILPNEQLLELLAAAHGMVGPALAVEMIASYGMPVGREVFETCVWIGRFIQAYGHNHHLVYRKDVKMHLCGSPRANDATIRQALIDRYGPGKDKAIGTTKRRGPLYGLKGDMWSALAVAVTFGDAAGKARAVA